MKSSFTLVDSDHEEPLKWATPDQIAWLKLNGCKRKLLSFYCAHNKAENASVRNIVENDKFWHVICPNLEYKEEFRSKYPTYRDYARKDFEGSKPYFVLEALYPVGFDMAALSPLDINVNLKSKTASVAGKMKEKVAAPAPAPAMGAKQAKPSREKDHPPPPPQLVQEPPSKGRPTGAIYETGKLLGKGGFAICHEGRRQGSREVVALKIVKSQMPQKKMEQKFQTELQIHSKMHHPNIVEFYRAFTYEESTYIILELCPNGSLMDMVKKRRFITEPEVRFYTIQIAGAIKYMHSKGIIHRDLKMGNIFLDKDMNVKIGDFGLAALLISGKDMATVRRTTLCGTPNYIAPEILEKGKKGHDHAVDIWSLGIIIFAMLTGRPPFQSPTQDEIYRKAKERDYDWPAMDKSDNYICQEAKDLVATMLQQADERPDCDTIVQHPFFSCGWVPTVSEMIPELKTSPPDANMFGGVGRRGGRANLYARNMKALCVKSQVGPWSEQHGEDAEGHIKLSVYNEMRSEQKYGLTPDIPLAAGIVYKPYHEAIIDVKADRQARQAEARAASQRGEHEESNLTYRPAANRIPQSFAAQQRAQHPGSAQKPREPAPTVMAPPRRPRAQAPEPEVASKTRAPTGYTAASESDPRAHSRNKSQPEPVQPTTFRSTRGMGGMISGAPRRAASRSQSEEKQERELAVEKRLVEELAKDLAQPKDEEKPQPQVTESMFSPWEKIDKLPNSTPDEVLRRLERFQAEIQRALNSRSLGTVQKPEREHHLVVKWVDYTNKYGLGYILNDGSVGCIFKALPVDPVEGTSDKYTPPSAIVVRHGEQHLLHRENRQYEERDQLVPIGEGREVEFYENRGGEGQYVSKVPAKDFKASTAPGRAMRLMRGKDEWDDRKREKLVIWKKFANYMTVFGRDEEHPRDEPVGLIDAQPHNGMVVTFYQRLGDVGIWGFYDGSFQFNFPDHTKLVLSPDGSWCDFYHLPLEAARDLAEKGSIPPAALDDRQHLSYSVQAFLNFMRTPSSTRSRSAGIEIDPMHQGIPAANDFRRKMQFVNSVVCEWISNGGIGASAMNPKERLRWTGYRELVNTKVPYKHVWVTVGGAGGDDRRVAWFDPREAGRVMPDIEQPRS